MDPITQLNACMAAAVAALTAGDYGTSINNALAAQGLLSCLPKISRSAGAGGGEQSAAWDAAGIDNFIKRLRQQQGSAMGMVSVPVVISEPAVIDDGQQFANSSGGYVQ
jgi:hypothetical protein